VVVEASRLVAPTQPLPPCDLHSRVGRGPVEFITVQGCTRALGGPASARRGRLAVPSVVVKAGNRVASL
jgi:hypothetical protein